MKLSNKQLDILGQGYQLAYEERLENLQWIGKSQSDIITIADTWQWFNIEKLDGCMPNSETFELLLALAKDIDRIDDMVRKFPFINEKDQLLTLMNENPKLHKKIDLQSFASHIKRCNGDKMITYTLNWILDREVENFNHIIQEINKQTYDYSSKETWMHHPYSCFDGVTEVRLRKGVDGF